MRRATVLAFGLVLLASWAGPSSAQEAREDSPHGKLDWDLDCSACHTPEGWSPPKANMEFDHDDDTEFQLLGRHKEATCGGCHLGLRFDEPSVDSDDCGACHVDVHLGNLSDNCAGCHGTLSFTDIAGLSIHARTSFPLTGAHLQVSCESCHIDDRGGSFSALDSDCVACHAADYETAVSIDHVALGFSVICQGCHNTLGWGGGPFDHVAASNGFELVGAHSDTRCEGCHVLPSFALIHLPTAQNDCYACHQSDYDREHTGSGFPTECANCHDQRDWQGAVIIATEHDPIFPIFSGPHEGKWSDCTICHTVPNTHQVFSCLNCHEHAQDTMDQKHQNVDGYVYISTLCYDCHPSGRKERG